MEMRAKIGPIRLEKVDFTPNPEYFAFEGLYLKRNPQDSSSNLQDLKNQALKWRPEEVLSVQILKI